ncbi:nucleotidyltransferase domain-containing protein [Jeotgalibacillus aurantiacus]|uniref:nucleotidyltransferase domain-containing protein n=1 Tax=Jeotgalibacillus aurantiacus TaxID=2763266 RepID=UPI001D0B80BB|nr:nucleotidyltransferase domain-containing protein [Jeotgalibacillus aurantiacus]
MDRLDPIQAAGEFVNQYFPHCNAAVLAGSVSRGESTSTSDLDIVVFDPKIKQSYRESLIEYDWPIEVFVHNLTSYSFFFKDDCKHGKPSMPHMVAHGIVLKGSDELDQIRQEADMILKKGPAPWSDSTIKLKRYMITDLLDDLMGSNDRGEDIMISAELSILLQEFMLRVNNRWIGSSKWMIRELKRFDPDYAETFTEAFDQLYTNGHKAGVKRLVEESLQLHGGLLFEGFSIGKS